MKRSSIFGALALCALSLCAFGAASASASQLTAVTCEKVGAGTGNYKTAECLTPKAGGSEFETKALPVGTLTEITGGPIGTTTLKGTAAGLNIQVTCEAFVGTTAVIANTEPTPLQHVISTSKIFIAYIKCHAALQSELAKKCEVESITGEAGKKGTIATNELKSTTAGQTEHNIKFEPATAGASFAEFKVLTGGCAIPNVTVKVTGSVLGVANTEKHSHITFTPATNGGLLKANGAAASYEGTNSNVMKGTTTVLGAETFT